MARSREGRVQYADWLRTAAMIAVIVVHVSGGWLPSVPIGSFEWHVLNVFDGLSHWCVPIFVMLSGAFLLDPKRGLSYTDLLLKYILRMVTALLVFGMLYLLLGDVIGGIPVTLERLPALPERLWNGGMETHLWYLPMAIGLYLLTPVLRAFLRGATRADLHWFLFLCALFAVALPAVQHVSPSEGLDFWVGQLRVHLVLGYVGYYMAGYYLKTYALGPLVQWLVYLLGLGGVAVTVWGTYLSSQAAGVLSDVFYGYMSPGIVALSVSVFVFFRYVLGSAGARGQDRGGGAASVSFGVYLVHVVFLNLLRVFFRYADLPAPPFHPILAVPLCTLAVFLPSFFTAWLLHKIPLLGRYLT